MMQVGILGSEVVIGGDNGYARLYDIKSGCLLQMLEHSCGERGLIN